MLIFPKFEAWALGFDPGRPDFGSKGSLSASLLELSSRSSKRFFSLAISLSLSLLIFF